MGEEIPQSRFRAADFARFEKKLRAETERLGRCFEEEAFARDREDVGFELEFSLIDEEGRPAPHNEELLAKLEDPHLVAELSRFNLEMNSEAHALKGRVLSALEQELKRRLGLVQACAAARDYRALMIGTLPSLEETELHLGNMSPLRRYRALNDRLLELRDGRPFRIEIRGKDRLTAEHRDVMLEAAATSLQIHLQVDAHKALRYYNASLIASGPLAALAANSPYLFGRDLWDETRIPLFEQATGLDGGRDETPRHPARVSFGWSYLQASIFELYEENLRAFPVLLPVLAEGPEAALAHLRLHNGTIWRWNRPLIVPDAEAGLHLRIEHRVMAAGPTPIDVVANIAAYLGLVRHLAELKVPPEAGFAFKRARENFYRGAREGLRARLSWIDGRELEAVELWEKTLLPAVRKALHMLGLEATDLDRYLTRALGGRLKRRMNGATWQRQWVASHGPDFPALTRAYAERQGEGSPVAEWKV